MKNTLLVFALMVWALFSNAQIIDIPDPNFKYALVNTKCIDLLGDGVGDIDADENDDGEIDENEALKVKILIVSDKGISKLHGIQKFTNLTYLNCAQNNIDSINTSYFPNLGGLIANKNKISFLEIKNKLKLVRLNIDQNTQLSELDLSGNINLEEVYCSNYYTNGEGKIKKINLKNCNLIRTFKCSSNLIDSLDFSSATFLRDLHCDINKLQYLNLSKNYNLINLYAARNNLTDLDLTNNEKLRVLDLSYNRFTILNVNHLINLIQFNVVANKLVYLFMKNGRKEFTYLNFPNFYFSYNHELKYVCCDDFEINSLSNQLSIDTIQNCEINSYCSFTPGGNFYSLKGSQVFDLLNDGCDDNDLIIPNLKFTISSNNGSGSFISDETGNYYIPVQEGTHTIKPILENPDYFNVSPDSITVTFPSTSDTIIQDFCITPKGIYKQVDLSIIPLTPPARPGFNAQYKVVMTNKGNQVENGTLNFNYDEARLDFVSTDVNPTTQTDGWLTWDFKDLLPFETRYYIVTLNVNTPSDTPPVNAGDELIINCSILDNVFSLKQTVVGSYDPNDKTCLEGNKITPEQVGKYIHYLIRFENTGNYAAENIVVKDVIDETTFDLSSLQITDASHEAWARINNNIVEFIFENIQLPFDDANNDGYIAFKIKTKPTLQLGNELKNEANIYFDYNLPILTNKTNTVVAIPDATDEALGSSEVEVFPNPVNDVLKFNTDEKIHKVEIYDVSGRLVQVSSVVNDEVNVEGLAKGSYVMKLRSRERVRVGKIMKM